MAMGTTESRSRPIRTLRTVSIRQYVCPELADVSEVKSGSPWGAATIAGSNGSRQPSAKELAQARFQGRHVASVAKKLCV